MNAKAKQNQDEQKHHHATPYSSYEPQLPKPAQGSQAPNVSLPGLFWAGTGLSRSWEGIRREALQICLPSAWGRTGKTFWTLNSYLLKLFKFLVNLLWK